MGDKSLSPSCTYSIFDVPEFSFKTNENTFDRIKENVDKPKAYNEIYSDEFDDIEIDDEYDAYNYETYTEGCTCRFPTQFVHWGSDDCQQERNRLREKKWPIALIILFIRIRNKY